jgi:uncharacterized protein with ATP-grasp and redox domains
MMDENQFPEAIATDLEALSHELLHGKVRSLHDTSALDWAEWETYLQPYQGQPWLDVPWFFAETYFYRRILEATRYFVPGDWQGVDPFASQKRSSLDSARDDVQRMSAQINEWYEQLDQATDPTHSTTLLALLYGALWGNQADLSLQPGATLQIERQIREEQSHILIDDTPALTKQLAALHQLRLDWVADNAGVELMSDLYLIDWLLTRQIAATVHLHLKAHPTFVSDATVLDVQQTLAMLAADDDRAVQTLARRLSEHLSQGRLHLHDDRAWTSPLAFWQLPPPIQAELAQSDLVVVKGDANYRRLLGDRHWAFTTPLADLASYFPAPLVALRTLKSNVAAGLHAEQVETLNQTDPDWLTNGKWGVIQFVDASSTASPTASPTTPM